MAAALSIFSPLRKTLHTLELIALAWWCTLIILLRSNTNMVSYFTPHVCTNFLPKRRPVAFTVGFTFRLCCTKPWFYYPFTFHIIRQQCFIASISTSTTISAEGFTFNPGIHASALIFFRNAGIDAYIAVARAKILFVCAERNDCLPSQNEAKCIFCGTNEPHRSGPG